MRKFWHVDIAWSFTMVVDTREKLSMEKGKPQQTGMTERSTQFQHVLYTLMCNTRKKPTSIQSFDVVPPLSTLTQSFTLAKSFQQTSDASI